MMARRAGIQGPVVVRGIVRRDGTIDNVEVIRDLPYGLGEAARDAVSQWHFRPATVRGGGEPKSERLPPGGTPVRARGGWLTGPL
mgnify:CR=1 FL=1